MNNRKVIVADIGFGVIKLTANEPTVYNFSDNTDMRPGIIMGDIMQPSCAGTEEVCPAGSVSLCGIENLKKLRAAIDEAIQYATTAQKAEQLDQICSELHEQRMNNYAK